jgi:hypothetical protein
MTSGDFIFCANQSLQIVHCLGVVECSRTPREIALCIEPPGKSQGRCKRRLCLFLGPFNRARRWLAIDLSADRLCCHWSGKRFPSRLPYREFELCDVVGAGSGVCRRGAQAVGREEEGRRNSSVHSLLSNMPVLIVVLRRILRSTIS